MRFTTRVLRSAFAAALALAPAFLVPSPARAHFMLQSPPSWMSQDSLGNPQKTGPCGDEGGGTATGVVTSFQPGGKVTITINETVFHPGHYRIALATTDRSQLPAEPPVTAGATACGTVPIQSPPVFPVIADGVFVHTAPFSGPQTVEVTLPSGVTCTHCTLQVLEFMSSHGAPCFYHHCADIAIGYPSSDGGASDASMGDAASSKDGAAAGDGATGAGAQDGATGGTSSSSSGAAPPSGSGGGCSVPGARPPTGAGSFALLIGVAALAHRRSRRRLAVLLPVTLAIAACGALGVRALSSTAYANGAETHGARGVVKSFGPGRAFVNIAHEKIPGYMEAMTMSFEPRSPDQLAPFREADKVSFTFTATSDGRRLLDAIKKE